MAIGAPRSGHSGDAFVTDMVGHQYTSSYNYSDWGNVDLLNNGSWKPASYTLFRSNISISGTARIPKVSRIYCS